MQTVPLLLVRHARAGRRSAYKGNDLLRPLSKRGRAQADALVSMVAGYRPQRILSSPYVRCCETVRPLADSLSLAVESVDELAEGNGEDAIRLIGRMAGESAVLCTHGDVALSVLEELAGSRPAAEQRALRLEKGDIWVIHSVGSSLAIVDHLRQVILDDQRSA